MIKFFKELFSLVNNQHGWIMAAVAVASSLMAAKGQADAASAQAGAAKAMMRAKRRQAKELLDRSIVNAERMRAGGERTIQEQRGAFAAGGVALGAGSTLAVMNDTINQNEQGVQDMLLDAKSQAAALRSGADIDSKTAGQIQEAGRYQVASSLLQGAYNTGSLYMRRGQ